MNKVKIINRSIKWLDIIIKGWYFFILFDSYKVVHDFLYELIMNKMTFGIKNKNLFLDV